ncbi:tetratricopeptide repeat protein [Rubrolithibacter danxiaensis]|uniref:tetratricopeptide repeat protein n=1 Tax=Rubrolithibacter danxiaensis TaxID=3390805 RepID=UPI003BF7722D
MKYFFLAFVLTILTTSHSFSQSQNEKDSFSTVDELNKLGYEIRLTDPEQTIEYGKRSLHIAKKLDYPNGIGEAYRIMGIGKYYMDKNEEAISDYLLSLKYFKSTKNKKGEAKVNNNIGNLYRDVDNDKGLKYYQEALTLAQDLNMTELIAGTYLNIGIIQTRKKNFNQALKTFENSDSLFKKLDDPIGITHSLQNQGVAYYKLHQLEKAERFLLQANQKAKENDLNSSIASINLTLTSVFVAEKRFEAAEKTLTEGQTYARLVKNAKLEQDYIYTSYELESARKNFEKALYYLQQVYKTDSLNFNNNVSARLGLQQEQFRQLQKERENELIIAKQRNNLILFWASTLVSFLLLLVIGLLVYSNRRKIRTNKQLTVLNSEISQQKEELDWINHRLEEIIDERTKDLKIKNQKLSDYSWHLSHQIRGPVATMKGLMILENDQLIEHDEFIQQMDKCLKDVDDKITNINESLHDENKMGFSSSVD